MNKQLLISAIENHRKKYMYTSWTVGITNDPARRKGEHENAGKSVGLWKDWKADSEKIAREVEKYFLDKGMKGGGGGGDKPTYVYIF
jgi:hypothetical protein